MDPVMRFALAPAESSGKNLSKVGRSHKGRLLRSSASSRSELGNVSPRAPPMTAPSLGGFDMGGWDDQEDATSPLMDGEAERRETLGRASTFQGGGSLRPEPHDSHIAFPSCSRPSAESALPVFGVARHYRSGARGGVSIKQSAGALPRVQSQPTLSSATTKPITAPIRAIANSWVDVPGTLSTNDQLWESLTGRSLHSSSRPIGSFRQWAAQLQARKSEASRAHGEEDRPWPLLPRPRYFGREG